jgi:hypothetical protein
MDQADAVHRIAGRLQSTALGGAVQIRTSGRPSQDSPGARRASRTASLTCALQKGEIDMIELPQHDLLKVMDADRNIKLVNLNKWGKTYINAVGENAWFGWPLDDELLKLRTALADETDAAKRKDLAVAMQVRVSENPTHAFLGQWYAPVAMRKNINGMLESPVTIFWNIEKK